MYLTYKGDTKTVSEWARYLKLTLKYYIQDWDEGGQ